MVNPINLDGVKSAIIARITKLLHFNYLRIHVLYFVVSVPFCSSTPLHHLFGFHSASSMPFALCIVLVLVPFGSADRSALSCLLSPLRICGGAYAFASLALFSFLFMCVFLSVSLPTRLSFVLFFLFSDSVALCTLSLATPLSCVCCYVLFFVLFLIFPHRRFL